jgi:lipoprotein-anchoring transpeptidase ErfK/SrfK
VRRRERRYRVVITLLILIVVVGGGWWLWPRGDDDLTGQTNGATADASRAGADRPPAIPVPEAVIVADTAEDAGTDEVLTPKGSGSGVAGPVDAAESAQAHESENDQAAASPKEDAAKLSRNPRIEASLQRYRAGEVLAARQELNRMLMISRNPAEQAELRGHLEQIANDTIFSKGQQPDDPLITTYVVQPGDALINIGKQFAVPHEAIMMINGISERIHPGQRLKVPRGPFNAKIYKSAFRLDVYLQDLYLRSFPVALGVDHGTPEGEWKVKERLPNPTYYPPASAEIKRIIPPDDPTNPLGEHWIGLEGIDGGAVGRVGFGIHGTIEPESIGKAVSLGCVRMHNADVEFLYGLMLPGHSKVTTLP